MTSDNALHERKYPDKQTNAIILASKMIQNTISALQGSVLDTVLRLDFYTLILVLVSICKSGALPLLESSAADLLTDKHV